MTKLRQAKFLSVSYMALFSLISCVQEVDISDKRFLKNAIEAGNFEIIASALAAKKTKNANLQAFVKMINIDQMNTNAKLKILAVKKGVILSAELGYLHQGELKNLESSKDNDLDRSINGILGKSNQEKTLKIFEETFKDTHDPDIKKFIADTLPILKQHVDDANAIDSKVKSVHEE